MTECHATYHEAHPVGAVGAGVVDGLPDVGHDEELGPAHVGTLELKVAAQAVEDAGAQLYL